MRTIIIALISVCSMTLAADLPKGMWKASAQKRTPEKAFDTRARSEAERIAWAAVKAKMEEASMKMWRASLATGAIHSYGYSKDLYLDAAYAGEHATRLHQQAMEMTRKLSAESR